MAILLFFQFFLYYFPIIDSQITLDFKRKWSGDFTTEKNIISNLLINDLITKIKIGTPPQEGYLSLNFKDYSTYISVQNCSTETPKFNEKKSTSYSLITNKNTYYYTGFEEGSISNDSIYINEKLIKNFLFISVYKLRQDNFFLTTELGVLGLNLKFTGLNKDLDNINFIKELKFKNLINSCVFSIKFINENDGKIIIGNYPHEYDESFNLKNLIEIPSHKVGDNGEWGINFDNITSGDIDISGNFFSSYIYLENGIFYSNHVYQKIINKCFFEEYLNKNICIKKEFIRNKLDYQMYICEKRINLKNFPILKFHLKDYNFNFEFDYNDLFYEYNNKLYFLIAFTKSSYWRLGVQFFKKYRLIFNQDKRIIGIYDKKYSKNNVNDIFKWAILIILTSIIIFLYINIKNKRFLKLFKTKKITANELEDNINYNNLNINIQNINKQN